MRRSALGCLLLLVVCLTVEGAWGANCRYTSCNPVPECPHRPELMCIIHEAYRTHFFDMNSIIFDPRFTSIFGGLPTELRNLETSIKAGDQANMEGVEEFLSEFGEMFADALQSTCLISVQGTLEELIQGAVEGNLDFYHHMLVQLKGPSQECPNRGMLQQLTNGALVQRRLDVFGILRSPTFATDMGELPGMIRGVEDAIDTATISDIKTLSEQMENLLEEFVDTLEERCYLLVGKALLRIIEDAFDRETEFMIHRMQRRGGTEPPFCPNRASILRDIRSALNHGWYDAVFQLFNPRHDSEFGVIRKELLNFYEKLERQELGDAKDIVLAVTQAKNSFIEILEEDPGCFIKVRSRMRSMIEDSFEYYLRLLINTQEHLGGKTGTGGCPHRDEIQTELDRAHSIGSVNALGMVVNSRYSEDFGKLAEEHDKLRYQLRMRGVTARRTISERVAEMKKLFLLQLRESCYINVHPDVEEMIEDYYDFAVEGYCRFL